MQSGALPAFRQALSALDRRERDHDVADFTSVIRAGADVQAL